MKRCCNIFVVLCLVAGIVTAVTARPVRRQSPNSLHRGMARILVDQVMLIKHWEAFEGDTEFSDAIKAMMTDFKSQDYEYLTIVLPDRPINAVGPKQSLDEFEQRLLDHFTRRAPEKGESGQIEYAERLTANGREYQYYQPILAKKSCLRVCHAPSSSSGLADQARPFVEGRPVAVMRITIPIRAED